VNSDHFRQTLAGVLAGALLMAALPGVAATVGDAFALGTLNRIDAKTTLKGDPRGAMLQVQSTGNAGAILVRAGKNALKVRVGAGESPIHVNPSAGTAKNLSADELDGMDSTAFLGATDKARDSDELDGKDSTELVPAASCDPGTSFAGFDRSGVVCRLPSFHRQTVTTTGNTGLFTSIALDSAGHPVVAYRDSTAGTLVLAHCNDPRCVGDDESIEVVHTYPFEETSLALNGMGNPVISYGDASLVLTICGDPDCASAAAKIQVIVDDDGGQYSSLALDAAGNPVVSYKAGGGLRVARCGHFTCFNFQGGPTVEIVDPAAGDDTSIVLDAAGNPVIAYYDPINTALKLAHCNDPKCAGGDESIVVVDDTGGAGAFPSLTLDALGNPVISYEGDSTALNLVHCNDPNCAGGDESIEVVDNTGIVGAYTSLVLDVLGNPVISYYDSTNTALKLAHCNDPDCAGGDETIQTVDNTASVGTFNSMVLDEAGNPVIGYYDASGDDLRVASV